MFSLNVVKTKPLLIASSEKQKHLLESGEKPALEAYPGMLRDVEAIPHIKCIGIYVDHTLNWKNKSNRLQRKLLEH